MIFQAGTTYTLITSNGYCKHVDGGFPAVCEAWGDSLGSAKSHCTNLALCVGYQHNATGSTDIAHLFVTDYTPCPDGYTYLPNDKPAKTMNELVAKEHSKDIVCYGKSISKSIFFISFNRMDFQFHLKTYRILNSFNKYSI